MVTYTDQEIRDKGFKYIPQQKYLLNPFVIPTTDDDDGGNSTPSVNVGGNSEGFSVYNPDPNRTRTIDQYSPYNYRQANERSLIGLGDSQFDINKYGTGFRSETEAQKFMDMYPEYYRGKQLEGIPGAISKYMKNSLAGKLIGKVVSGIEGALPVNNRAILENELLGQGFQLNDIGQFVSDGGDINKADGSNIMAGYNAAKVTRQTFEKRRDMINAKMKDPVQKAAKLAALDAAEDKFFGGSAKATTVFNDKLKQKDIKKGFINDQGSTYDEEIFEEEEKIIDPKTLRYITKKKTADTTGTDTGTDTGTGTGTGTGTDTGTVVPGGTVYANQNDPSSVSTSGLTYNQGGGQDGSYDFVEQNFDSPAPQRDYSTHHAYGLREGGRVYFFDGGRVAVMNGGLVSLL